MDKKRSFFRQFGDGVRKTLAELKEDSVASNPRKPVDCCNPPVPRGVERKQNK